MSAPEPRPVSAPPLVVVTRNSSTESGVTRRTLVKAARFVSESTSAPSSVILDWSLRPPLTEPLRSSRLPEPNEPKLVTPGCKASRPGQQARHVARIHGKFRNRLGGNHVAHGRVHRVQLGSAGLNGNRFGCGADL